MLEDRCLLSVTANPDAYSVVHDQVLTVQASDVLANDTSDNMAALTAVLVSGPAHGTLAFNADGTFVYTPNTHYAGADSFTYYATDGVTNSSPVTASLDVVENAPVADDQTLITDENTPVSGNALASDADGDALTYALVAGPNNGSLSLSSNGSFTYTPNTGFIGTDSFTFKTNDGVQDSNTGTVFVIAQAPPVTYTVINGGDAGNGNGNTGDLRYCINQANNNPGRDIIKFNIGGGGVQTINVTAALPRITGSVIIDGLSEGGQNYAGPPLIYLDGAGIAGDGLDITAGNSTVKGLIVSGFRGDGIWLHTQGGNTVTYCYVGTDPTGTQDQANAQQGIRIESSNNTIGGLGAAGNLISGNTDNGILVSGPSAKFNVVIGNYIGTDSSGLFYLGNGAAGVAILSGAANNYVGTNLNKGGGLGNVISGNDGYGVLISDSGTTNNLVASNYIGTDATGMSELANDNDGVLISDSASNNTVGGAHNVLGNVISGNMRNGVEISPLLDNTAQPHDNHVYGNYIGVAANGVDDLGNGANGVYIYNGGYLNDIGDVGGVDTGKGNVISWNSQSGVLIQGLSTTKNSVYGNFIGLDKTGTKAAGNLWNGVAISGASENNIGGAGWLGNVISANGSGADKAVNGFEAETKGHGVTIYANANNNVVAGNYIGTDVTGTKHQDAQRNPLGNYLSGVYVSSGVGNRIGGIREELGNIIAGNGWSGFGYGVRNGATNTFTDYNWIGLGPNYESLPDESGSWFEEQSAVGTKRGGHDLYWEDIYG